MSSSFTHAIDWITLTFRLGFALFLGGAIGWNRQAHNKAAGLRTHMLVSLGAALFVLVPLHVDPAHQSEAISRSIQGIATGIGFVGAGEILQSSRQQSNKPTVTGLTSAVAIWVAAALGISAGCGLWQLGIVGTLFALFVLGGVKRFEAVVFPDSEEDG
jgi:putative Mg2+ transporter-C (MgtC) family protein